MSNRDDVFKALLDDHVTCIYGDNRTGGLKFAEAWKQKYHAAVRADNLAEYQRRLAGRAHAEPVRPRPSVHEIAMCLMAIIKMPHYYSDVGEWAKYIYQCAQKLYDAGTAWEQHQEETRH